ncbi:uncharacterized protein LOC141605219 [Silene latifolia]|uniref:uncharacterized protein LOC141605219 n=1 Tax=Silene latifolia TaxID=37657 RepID=UPI003D77304F
MDSFTRNFSNNHRTLKVPFVLDANQRVWCYAEHHLNVKVDDTLCSVPKKIRQPMTPLGLMSLQLEGMDSVYGGVNKTYLTPEGQISIPAVSDTLKWSSGKSPAEVSYHIGAIQSCRWEDNHVSLLFNMLRYVFLQRFREARGNLDGQMGIFTEEALAIDMDQWWPAGYPATAAFTSWPTQPTVTGQGQEAGHNGVRVQRLLDAFPSDNVAALDLHNLSQKEEMFVLIMLNAWRRTSRYRLDAELPLLTEHVIYRGHDVTECYNSWALGTAVTPFLPLDSAAAWHAMSRYVSQNRLFDHFSAALYLVTALTYQYVPDVAEATAWLPLQWLAVLPEFFSIRGRFTFFTTGEGAFINQRPFDEWKYIGGHVEKINLMALTFAQAFSMGIAIRGMRQCFELEPDDVHQTDMDFWNAEKFASAAVAEFTRIDVPLSGMGGVYITCGENLDHIDSSREVLTMNLVTEDVPQTHHYGMRRVSVQRTERRRVAADQVPPNYPGRTKLLATLNITRKMAELALTHDKDWVLSDEQRAALEDTVYIDEVTTAAGEYRTVMVPMLPPPGFPVFLTPTQPLPYPTPYDMAGVLNKETGDFEAKGNSLKLCEAWRVVSFLDSIGYDTQYKVYGCVIGAKKFLKGRHSEQMWPIYYLPEDGDLPVVLKTQTARSDCSIVIPSFVNKYFTSHSVTYKYHVYCCGVGSGRDRDNR